MRILPLGDRAIQVVLGDAPDEPTRLRVAAARARLAARRIPGVVECLAGFTTLTVHYELESERAYRIVAAAVEAALAGAQAAEAEEGERLVEIPVCYGGGQGPDLALVAAHAGMTPEEVIATHSGAEYRVHFLGFIPGFPYLVGLDPRLTTPRRDTPRTAVPAGSVGIGGVQTGVYPMESPGGWQLIGRTPLRLFDPHATPPALLHPGDRVRFRPVDAAELARLESA